MAIAPDAGRLGELSEGVWGEAPTLGWLASSGLPVVRHQIVADLDGALAAADALGYPVVLKVSDPTTLHKTELGGVVVGIGGPSELSEAFGTLVARYEARRESAPEGFMVQPMAFGTELIVGIKRDAALGPFVVVGSGGVFAELVADASVGVAPLSERSANDLLSSTRVVKLIDGYRGAPRVRRHALIELLVAISRLALEHPTMTELDLNPVMVNDAGAVVVDARMVVAHTESTQGNSSGASQPSPNLPIELFEPRSIAVIGASRDPLKAGGRLLRYLMKHGYDGTIYAVNKSATEVQGAKAVQAVSDLAPGSVDLACIAVPAERVADALRECARARIPAAIIFAGGFAEMGEEGAKRQSLLRVAASHDGHRTRFVGPNSNGVVSIASRSYSAIGMALEGEPSEAGTIGLVTQSGAVGSSLLSRGWEDGVRFSRWISAGNGADIDLADYVGFLATDDKTRVVLVFVEAIRDGAAFGEAVRACRVAGKPVVVYHTARSAAGRRVAASHTGALVGDDEQYEAFFRRIGALRARSVMGLLDAGRLLASVPAPSGDRVGIITMSGGIASVIADECSTVGLTIPDFDEEQQVRLRALIPGFASASNPIDVTAEAITDPATLVDCIELIATFDTVDLGIVQLTTNADPTAAQMAEGIADVVDRSAKPLVVGRLGSANLAPQALAVYRSRNIPVFDDPERLVAAAALLVEQGTIERGRGDE